MRGLVGEAIRKNLSTGCFDAYVEVEGGPIDDLSDYMKTMQARGFKQTSEDNTHILTKGDDMEARKVTFTLDGVEHECDGEINFGYPFSRTNNVKQKPEEIKILPPVANGYIVEVGCQKFVFTSREKMFKAISEYWNDPAKAQKKYIRKGGC